METMCQTTPSYGSMESGTARSDGFAAKETSAKDDDDDRRLAQGRKLAVFFGGFVFLLVTLAFSGAIVLVTAPRMHTLRRFSKTSTASLRLVGKSHFPVDPKKQTMPQHDPTKELFFSQIIDHDHPKTSGHYRQRYYENRNHFQPGHPIFLIFGGESELPKILYPFISEILAAEKGAYTINPEHRFFGKSLPVENPTKKQISELVTPRQAIQDSITLIQAKQDELGCGPRGSPTYCPVLTIGGSYAGLLSTLARVAYPNVVDMAYGAGPCLFLFDHSASPYSYYEQITSVAQRMSPGCPRAVHETLADVKTRLAPYHKKDDILSAAREYGVCANHKNPLPSYIENGADLAQQIIIFNSDMFGDSGMDNYPPSPDTKFMQACTIFKDESKSTPEKIRAYFELMEEPKTTDDEQRCHAFQESSDGIDFWDALCCQIVPMIGRSNDTMWFPKPFDVKAYQKDCQKDFGITHDVDAFVHEFGFDNLSHQTRLLLTNGVNDVWYPVSYLEPPGDGVVVMNFVNGAHHSELTHQLQADTPDIEMGHKEISDLVETWLQQVREEGPN